MQILNNTSNAEEYEILLNIDRYHILTRSSLLTRRMEKEQVASLEFALHCSQSERILRILLNF